MKRIGLFLLASIFALSLAGCAKFKEGDCIQKVNDGHYVWRITKVGVREYTMQGWFDGKWGLEVNGPLAIYDSDYVKIACPFSTRTIQ